MVRPRFPTLQERLSLVRVSGPSGEGTRQAVQTMNVLSSNLDRMSNYFFKRAEVIAEIEGEEFGSANTPSVDEYQKAIDAGDDPLAKFDRTTKFGSSAFNTVAKNLGNSLIVTAKEQMNNEYLNADKEPISILEFEKKLDSIVFETSKLANAISPGIGSQVTADLNITASGHYYKYGIKVNKLTNTALKNTATSYLENSLSNLETEIIAKLPKNGKADEKKISEELYGKDGIRSRLLAKHSKLMIGAKFGDTAYKKGIDDFNNKFTEGIFSTVQVLAFNNFKDLSDVTDDLRRGRKTGNAEIDALVSGLSQADKNKLATQISTTANNQNSLEEIYEEEDNEKADLTANDLEIKINNDINNGVDQTIILSDLQKLKKLVDPEDDNNAFVQLSKLNNETGGVRRISDQKIKKDLQVKASFGTLTFGELNRHKDSLTSGDFKTFATQVAQTQSKGFKEARRVLAKELGFLLDTEIKSVNDDQFAKGEVFTQIIGKLQEKEIEYNRTKEAQFTPFDHVKVVKDLARTDGEVILQSIFEKKKASFKRNYFDTFAKLYRDIIPENAPLNRANVEKMKAKLEDMEDDKNQREGLFINSNEKKALAKINLFISTAINMLAEERFTE